MRQFYYRICLFLGIYKEEDFVTVYRVVQSAYESYRKLPVYAWKGLCPTLCRALADIAHRQVSYKNIRSYIGKFNPKFLGAKVDMRKSAFWWPDAINASDCGQAYYLRLEALEKLQSYYFEHSSILIRKGDYFLKYVKRL